eukprot:8378592-Lingulodinium_polyedra.AAC.1
MHTVAGVASGQTGAGSPNASAGWRRRARGFRKVVLVVRVVWTREGGRSGNAIRRAEGLLGALARD